MNARKSLIAVVLLMLQSIVWFTPAQAAMVEYYRFEGLLPTSPPSVNLGGLALFPGQSIFLDFAIDTSITLPPGSEFYSIYPASYYRGSVRVSLPVDVTAIDVMDPDGPRGLLFTTDTGFPAIPVPPTALGISATRTGTIQDPFEDLGIGSWRVGQSFELSYLDSAQTPIGEIELTYRDTVPPVPIPSAVWLLATVLVGLRVSRQLAYRQAA